MDTKHLSKRALAPLLLLLAATSAEAQWSSDPAQNLAVADPAGEQVQTKLAPTADGGCYVSWYDGGSGYDVRLQKLDAAGFELFPHGGILVADRSFSSTQDYGLDVDASGNALLAFRDDRFGGTQISAATVSPAGALLWGASGVQLTNTNSFVAAPKIAGTSDGSIVVAWTMDADTKLQKLDAAGTPQWGAGITQVAPVGTYSASDLHDSGTGVILAIVHGTGGFTAPKHLVTQKFNSAGAAQWGANPINVFDVGSLQFGNFPTFITDGAGGAVYSWYSTAGSLQCYAQRILANGTEAFTHNGVALSTNGQRVRTDPTASFDTASGETTLFFREMNGSQSMRGLYGQKLDASGNRLWTNNGTQVVALGGGELSQVRTAASGGGAFVTWNAAPSFNTDQLFGAHLDASGNIDIPAFDVASTQSGKSRPAIATNSAGQVVLAWGDKRSDGGDIYAQSINPDGSLGALGSGVGTAFCFGIACPCGNDDPSAGCANSTGSGALLSGSGGSSVAADDLVLTTSGMLTGAFNILFMGPTSGAPVTMSDGLRCTFGTLYRFPVQMSDVSGTSFRTGLVAQAGLSFPAAGQITSGTTWTFQSWYRDPVGPCGTNSTVSNALAVTFTP
ncbi:MAG: hypothetical protein ACI8QC_001865 [Planctomycetota bacterium]|jgi:hypothetical protein